MKKNLKVVSSALFIFLILLSSFVEVFAAGSPPLSVFGQNQYMTGENFCGKPIIDGYIEDDEGWISVTPDGAKIIFTDTTVGAVESSSQISIVEPVSFTYLDGEPFDIYSLLQTKYFVAQDDDYVYLAVQQTVPNTPFKCGGDDFHIGDEKRLLTYVKLGFNHYDYTQQLTLFSRGDFVAQDEESELDGVVYEPWTLYPLVLNGIGDNANFTEKTGHGIIESPSTDSAQGCLNDVVNNIDIRCYEVKLKKSAIKELYTEVFGFYAGEAIDFSSMYIGITWQACTTDGETKAPLCWANGTVQNTNYMANSFIPDVICFGNVSIDTQSEESSQLENNELMDQQPQPHKKSGCGATVSLLSIAFIVVQLSCTVFFSNEKD